MLNRNTVVKNFEKDQSWTCPAGIKQVYLRGYEHDVPKSSHSSASAFVDINGQVRSWGSNALGQLGDATVVNKSSPVVLSGLATTVCRQVVTNPANMAILTEQGDCYTVGSNTGGQLGDNSVVTKSSPVLVSGAGFLKFKMLAIGGFGTGQTYMMGLTVDHDLYGWGFGSNGQLGIEATTPYNTSVPQIVLGGKKWKWVACAGFYNTYAIDDNDDGWSWGVSSFGDGGAGTAFARYSPVQIVGGIKWSKIAGSIGIDLEGNLWSWGYNSNGQVGDGTTISKSSPVLIMAGTRFKDCAVSTFVNSETKYAIDVDGNLYAWGNNAANEFGDGTTDAKSTPTLIGTRKWYQINVQPGISAKGGITTDAQVYGWASNTTGSIGDGTTISKSTPVVMLGSQRVFAVDRYKDVVVVDVIPGTTYYAKVAAWNSTFGGVYVGTNLKGFQMRYGG